MRKWSKLCVSDLFVQLLCTIIWFTSIKLNFYIPVQPQISTSWYIPTENSYTWAPRDTHKNVQRSIVLCSNKLEIIQMTFLQEMDDLQPPQ